MRSAWGTPARFSRRTTTRAMRTSTSSPRRSIPTPAAPTTSKGNYLKLSRWAEAYERDHSGGIVCTRREEANQLRDAIEKRDAGAVLELMTQQRATFTGARPRARPVKQIKDEAERGRNSPKRFWPGPTSSALSDEAERRTTRYTTTSVLEAERQVLARRRRPVARQAPRGRRTRARDNSRRGRNSTASRREQARAFRHATGPEGLAIIDGQAGTGKSYTMAAIRQAYEARGRQGHRPRADQRRRRRTCGRDGFTPRRHDP